MKNTIYRDFPRKYKIKEMLYELQEDVRKKKVEVICNRLNISPSTLRRLGAIRPEDTKEAKPSQLIVIAEELGKQLTELFTKQDLQKCKAS